MTVVRTVEIIAHGITMQEVTAVTARREIFPVGTELHTHDDFRLVVLPVFPTAHFTGHIVRINIKLVQQAQRPVFLKFPARQPIGDGIVGVLGMTGLSHRRLGHVLKVVRRK